MNRKLLSCALSHINNTLEVHMYKRMWGSTCVRDKYSSDQMNVFTSVEGTSQSFNLNYNG